MRRNCVFLLFLAFAPGLVASSSAFAAEWQWSVEIKAIADAGGSHPRAFLWIPENCKQIRAVVFAQNNMIEEGILQHPQFRRALSRQDVAEIFVAPFFNYWQIATNNEAANENFSGLLKTLAAESGYAELEFAPIVPLGHSASASMPWNFAAWNPQRTLAILSVKGDAPRTPMTGNGRPNADWRGRNIDGIPGLMVVGEYEWLEGRVAPALSFRSENTNAPLALLALPGRGHFDYDDPKLIDYLARFIARAIVARLPETPPTNAPVVLKPVNPRDGWLVDRWRKDEPPRAGAAPFARYAGDKSQASWVFDRSMARFTEEIYASQRGKAPQLVNFVQDGRNVPQTATHNQINLKFEPEADGITFHVAADFCETVDGGSPNTTRWTGLPPGATVAHASTREPIRISRISGPVEQIDANTFTVRFNRSAMTFDRRAGDIWLLAEHPGDARFKSAVQQALMKIPVQLTTGADQMITFPEIQNVKAGTRFVMLNAVSDSGEKVGYFVREGPAEVNGNVLTFTKIPPRAKFPVRVTVVAWQYGRTLEPKLKSARPVERSFYVNR